MNHGEHARDICADPAEAAGQPGLTQIIDASPIPTFVLDHRHVITHWNRALAAISGIPQREAIGSRDPWRAFYLEARPVLADLIIDGANRACLVEHYGEIVRASTLIDGAFEAEGFFPQLTGCGRWLSSRQRRCATGMGGSSAPSRPCRTLPNARTPKPRCCARTTSSKNGYASAPASCAKPTRN